MTRNEEAAPGGNKGDFHGNVGTPSRARRVRVDVPVILVTTRGDSRATVRVYPRHSVCVDRHARAE